MEVFIRKIGGLPVIGWETVRLLLRSHGRVLPKGELLMREGTVAKYTYFCNKEGFARSFSIRRIKDITIWFCLRVCPFVHERVYVSTAGYGNVELLEECDC